MNPFLRAPEQYTREYNLEQTAKQDLAMFLSKSEGIPFEAALAYVDKVTGVGGAFERKDPEVVYLERAPNGDRERKIGRLSSYLEHIISSNLIITPSLTVYERPEVRKSIFGEYIQENLALRKADKKKMHIHGMRGEHVLSAYYKTLQESRKIKNNSLSGMHASPSTIGYNPTAHSSLTSLCRCATSYANSSNEKFLGGMRHYYAPTVVFTHILTAVRSVDKPAFIAVMDKYNLHYPTTDEVMKGIIYSSKHYWSNSGEVEKIRQFVDHLEPVEKAAFLYVGDLYHFDMYNGEFVKQFFDEMGTMVTTPVENPEAVIKGLNDNYKAIASLQCTSLISGMLLDDAKEQRPEAYNAVAATALNMQRVTDKYNDFITNILVQNYLPHSIFAFPAAVRKVVATSDTDSSILVTQYWADKYGDGAFTPKSMSVMYVAVFLVSALIGNVLAMYSANLGVSKDHVFTIEMKNEYIFPTYVITGLAKHYFAYILAKEGNVYSELDVERKGVNLRSSNSPRVVNDEAERFMTTIMDIVMQGKKWTAKEAMDFVANVEQQIYDDIVNGEAKLLNTTQVKLAESYTQGEENAAYKSYLFWNKYFSGKYGAAQTPPYRAIKVSVDLPNKTAISKWLASIEDPVIREGMTEWITTEGKTNVTIFRLPQGNVREHGIPKEILSVVNVRGIIREVTKPLYIVLESLGLYMINKRGTRIVLDENG